ncbi:MAG TPA: helix-turn-helix domain-containing protein [Thermodesulfobacteriota bacterium]
MGEPTEGLSALLGPAAAAALAAAFGGQRLYIPKAPRRDHPLVRALGLEAARQLAAQYGGTTLEVPHPRGSADQIRALAREGLTRAAIARRVGCSVRHVYRVLAGDDRASG